MKMQGCFQKPKWGGQLGLAKNLSQNLENSPVSGLKKQGFHQ